MSNFQMRIYNNSPIFFQNSLISIGGIRKTRQSYGPLYFRLLKDLETWDYTNAERTINQQEQEMQKLIKYAVKKSPFYKKFYKEIDIDSIQTIQDLKKLPILEKETVRQNADSLYTIDESHAIVSHISGISGTSLKLLFTKDDIQKRMAFLDFFKKQHGVTNLEMKRASFSAHRLIPKGQRKKIFWRDNLYCKQRLYSAYQCAGNNVKEYVEDLEEYQPEFIDGLSSAIYEAAKYINLNNIVLSFQPVAVFPTEMLSSHYRKEIEKAFNCPVRNHYASPEGSPFITECINDQLHYNLLSGVIETTEDGEMLVTSFHTYGTPLIRCKIGDRIKLQQNFQRCECGSSLPVIEETNSKTTDYLQSKSKGRFTAVFLSIISEKFMCSIKKMQFIQNSLETIDILIEAAEGYTNEVTAAVHEEMQYMFGDDMKFNIRIVEEIPLQPNNKFRLVINNINNHIS